MKDLRKQILKIAIPDIFGSIGLLLFDIVDIFWIAKLGTETLAGVASAGFLEWAVYSLMGITCVGCSTLISQAIGEKNQKKQWDVARESFYLTLLISLGLMVVLGLSASSVLKWMGLNPQAYAAGLSYYKVYIWGLPIFYGFVLTRQIFNAHGDTKTSNLILTGAIILNAILDPFLIFGWGPFPQWGAFGGAMATLISFGAGLLVRFYFLWKRRYIAPFRENFRWSSSAFKEILNIGIPTASARLVWSMVYPLLSTVITQFGMAPLAALTIAHRVESLAFYTAGGFSVAVATLVGQSMGRKEPHMARQIAYEGRKLITAILLPMSLIFLLIPEVLVGFLSQDLEVIQHGASYLRIIGLLEIFLGWEMVFEGGFNGVGETRPYMFVSIPLTLGRYPLAYLLVHVLGWGIQSIWWAISLSTLSKGVCLNLAFEKLKAFK